MRRNVCSTLALTIASCITVSACGLSHPNDVPLNQAKLADTVLAMRMSPRLDKTTTPDTKGQVVLVNDQGNVKVLEVGQMQGGDVLWGDNTLYFSGPHKEYALTKEKLSSIDRGTREDIQSLLLPTPKNDGYIGIYNVGIMADAYKQLVTTGDTSSIESWDIKGSFETIHQCGDKIVGITNIVDTRPIPAENVSGQSTPTGQSSLTGQGSPAEQTHPRERTELLVQLYPQPAADQGPLGSFTSTQDLQQLGYPAPCVNNIAYTTASTSEGDGESQQHKWMLRGWNTTTGEHHMHELHGPDGKPVSELRMDDVLGIASGTVINGKYMWATYYGEVYATDLNNGETVKLFATPPTMHERSGVMYQISKAMFRFHKNHLLVLNIPNDEKTNITLTSYDVNTGTPKPLLTVPQFPTSTFNITNPLLGFQDESNIYNFAVNPDWLDKKISSTQ